MGVWFSRALSLTWEGVECCVCTESAWELVQSSCVEACVLSGSTPFPPELSPAVELF